MAKENITTTINFDLDGTLADLYGVQGWLEMLISHNPTPYQVAKPLLRMNILARYLNQLQAKGYRLAVISWLSRNTNAQYDEKVTQAKLEWLRTHLTSVQFDEIHIVAYGSPKERFAYTPNDILFDDDISNRDKWTGKAYAETDILDILKTL